MAVNVLIITFLGLFPIGAIRPELKQFFLSKEGISMQVVPRLYPVRRQNVSSKSNR